MQIILIRFRELNNQSHKDLSKLLKISEESYRSKELGKSQFNINEMFLIANYYKKNIDEIFLPTKYAIRVQNREAS